MVTISQATIHRGGRHSRRYGSSNKEPNMHGIIYIIGLIVVILAILSFLGLA